VTFGPERGDGAVGSGGQEDIPEVSFATREVYLEMRAPLVRQRPLTEALDLSLGARYSDFSFLAASLPGRPGFDGSPSRQWDCARIAGQHRHHDLSPARPQLVCGSAVSTALTGRERTAGGAEDVQTPNSSHLSNSLVNLHQCLGQSSCGS
jgi:hypothetical protein